MFEQPPLVIQLCESAVHQVEGPPVGEKSDCVVEESLLVYTSLTPVSMPSGFLCG